MSRSNRLLAVGGVVTLLGAGLVFAVLTLGGSSGAPAVAPATGADADASPATIADASVDGAVAVAALDLPDGVEAVALTVDFQGSVAGLPTVGDRVHVYGLPSATRSLSGDDQPQTRIARLLEDVEVLAITGADHATNGGNPTVVLAVDPDDVAGTLTSHGTTAVHLTLVDLAATSTGDGDGSQAAGS